MTPQRHRPPGPASWWPGEQLFRFRRDQLRFLTEMSGRYGPVSSFRVGPQLIVIANDPEIARDILVTNQRSFKKGRGLDRTKPLLGDGLLTSEGEFHLRQRRLAQPAFHRERIAAYTRTMTEYTARHHAHWRDGQDLDLSDEMTALTLAIVAKTLFDADVAGDTERIRDAIAEAMRAFETGTLPFAEWFDNLPMPWVLRLRRARQTLDEIVYAMIVARRAEGGDRGDLLSMLMMARDTDGDGSGMSDTQLRDELLTIFIAGHETTANALAWSWYALCQNPEAEQALHAEVDALDGDPTVDDLARLPYARAVANETMRLYPPAWIIGRRALVPYQCGEYALPAGTLVFVSPWLMQRDARFWPEAERYRPERWLAEVERPRFTYFPFGGGSRICIGEPFAWSEIVLVLATVARRWRFELVEGHPVVPKPVVTLRLRDGLRVIARRR